MNSNEQQELERLFGSHPCIKATLEQTCGFGYKNSDTTKAQPIFRDRESLLGHVVQRAKSLGTWIERIEDYAGKMIGNGQENDVFISKEDIQNSPSLDSIPMNSTVEFFHRKMLYEEFRREMDAFIADSLPMAVDYGTLDSVLFVRDTLHFHYTVTPDMVGLFNDYNLSQKDYRDLIWYTDTEEFYEMLVELDVNITQHWHLPNNSLRSVTYSTAEIRQAIEMPEEEVRQEMRKMLLNEVIPAVNLECPFQEDDFTILDSVGIQNGMYTHYYKVAYATSSVNPRQKRKSQRRPRGRPPFAFASPQRR